MPEDLYKLLRPLLFALPPEAAHSLALRALSARANFGKTPSPVKRGTVSAMGLRFANPVGLAAGLDKNGECINGLARLGFGFVEVGTVTPLPQAGSPKPRIFRLPGAQAIINRMGFNNCGAAQMKKNLARRKCETVVGISLGKNAKTPLAQAADDYAAGLRALYACGDFFTVNISSPNTEGLRELQQANMLQTVLPKIMDARESLANEHGKRAPIAVKISPDLNEEELAAVAEITAACDADAIIATNTTTTRPPQIQNERNANEQGGLSGAPLRELSTVAIKKLRATLPRKMAIIASGGISTPAEALEKLQAGAQLVQLYTGLIYRGPSLPKEIIASFPHSC